VTIQRLKPDEALRLRGIRLRALADAPEAFATRLEQAAALPPESWAQMARELPTFLAVEAGRDVGLVRADRDADDADAAWLISLWVAPEARGRGVGDALVEAVVQWAVQRGFARLLLDVADDNHAAIALYARQGFTPTGDGGTLPAPRTHVREHRRALTLR